LPYGAGFTLLGGGGSGCPLPKEKRIMGKKKKKKVQPVMVNKGPKKKGQSQRKQKR